MNKSKYLISSKLSAADTACRIMTHNSPPRDSAKQYLAASTIKISAWHQKQDKSRQEKKCVQGTRSIHHEGDSWLYHWEVSVTTWMWWFGFSPSAPPHLLQTLQRSCHRPCLLQTGHAAAANMLAVRAAVATPAAATVPVADGTAAVRPTLLRSRSSLTVVDIWERPREHGDS